MIKLSFHAFATDLANGMTVVLLAAADNALLPIWIERCEAQVLAHAKTDSPEHISHTFSLISDLLTIFDGAISKIVITGLRERSYLSLLHIESGKDREYVISATPSDCLVLAEMYHCPIYASRDLKFYNLLSPIAEAEMELAERLVPISPEEIIM